MLPAQFFGQRMFLFASSRNESLVIFHNSMSRILIFPRAPALSPRERDTADRSHHLIFPLRTNLSTSNFHVLFADPHILTHSFLYSLFCHISISISNTTTSVWNTEMPQTTKSLSTLPRQSSSTRSESSALPLRLMRLVSKNSS